MTEVPLPVALRAQPDQRDGVRAPRSTRAYEVRLVDEHDIAGAGRHDRAS